MHTILFAFGFIFLEPQGYQFEKQRSEEFPLPDRQEQAGDMLAVLTVNTSLEEQFFVLAKEDFFQIFDFAPNTAPHRQLRELIDTDRMDPAHVWKEG